MAHNGGPNGNEPIRPVPAPAHAGATEAGLKLPGLTFGHAGANRITLFAEFQILHAPFVFAEIVGFGP
jgi:hypothetical protein